MQHQTSHEFIEADKAQDHARQLANVIAETRPPDDSDDWKSE